MTVEERSPSHLDGSGKPAMVDVSGKEPTVRTAVARGLIRFPDRDGSRRPGFTAGRKGDVLGVAVLAGIMAAKRVPDLIPLCHRVCTDWIDVAFESSPEGLEAVCTVRGSGRTGFEMEALTGVSVALLTVYDMLKSAWAPMVIDGIRLVSKSGGRTGTVREG